VMVLGAAAGIAAYLHFTKTPPAPEAGNPDVVVVPTPPTPPRKSAVPTHDVDPTLDPRESVKPAPPIAPDDEDPREVVSDPTPVPEVTEEVPTTPTVVAKFDVPGFLTNARKVMRDRAKPLLATHDSNLRSNIFSYERDIVRVISKLKSGRDSLEASLMESTAEWKTAGAKIPSDVPSDLTGLAGIVGIHDGALQRQVGIDNTLHQGLDLLSNTYLSGLQKRMDLLKEDNDAGAIQQLETEINEVKGSSKYFRELMMGSAASDEL
jgi:hypothetical protein